MDNERITVRLPKRDISAIDAFIDLGEFATRSEVIRHAVRDYLRKSTSDILESAQKIKEMQQLQQEIKSIESYLQK
jgi:Arc/MetJ-type ribon-helix-helix transcriptional regulator